MNFHPHVLVKTPNNQHGVNYKIQFSVLIYINLSVDIQEKERKKERKEGKEKSISFSFDWNTFFICPKIQHTFCSPLSSLVLYSILCWTILISPTSKFYKLYFLFFYVIAVLMALYVSFSHSFKYYFNSDDFKIYICSNFL